MVQTKKARFLSWLIIAMGAGISLNSLVHFTVERLDVDFLLLALIQIGLRDRLAIQIPKVGAQIYFSDSIPFLALLLYGGEAAVLLAALGELFSSHQYIERGATVNLNSRLLRAAAMACATSLMVFLLRFQVGHSLFIPVNGQFSTLIFALGLMAVIQALGSSWLEAIALTRNETLLLAWRKYFLSASLNYLAAVVTTSVLVKLGTEFTFTVVIITSSVIGVLYFTYKRYIENLKQSARQAEQAERERAEQAERHIAELNLYIQKQDRISSALKESKDRFRHAALHDTLTGLPNRTLFTEHLQKAVERAKRDENFIFAVLFLDFDRFKYVNDSLGHTFGDQLLIQVSKRLSECVRQMDTVARFGGDEFGILLDGIGALPLAIQIAERIQQAMTLPFHVAGHETFLSTSVGIALSTAKYDNADEVLRDADIAMYRAKASGKARHEIFDKTMHVQTLSRLHLENDLRRAIERNEFFVHYQPIIRVGSGKLYGFEALVRWQHPERGLVSPAEFISVAEETGLIIPLGRLVLAEACRQVREWQCQFPAFRSLILSVNLSGKQLNDTKFIQEVKDILLETEFDPQYLRLEITESVVMDNAEASTILLKQLRALGLQLSIDDFGTGYSSLSYLHRFPVTTLKIDRSFVSLMGQRDENLEIVRTIVTLARNLNMDVVAEGIETTEQHAQLNALSCQFGQGYLFSKPLGVDAVCRYIEGELVESDTASIHPIPPNNEAVNGMLIM